jgi:hypothetical protein
MYPEVSCPSRLLYSIYTDREAQCNTTNNHTQYIILTINLTESSRKMGEFRTGFLAMKLSFHDSSSGLGGKYGKGERDESSFCTRQIQKLGTQ